MEMERKKGYGFFWGVMAGILITLVVVVAGYFAGQKVVTYQYANVQKESEQLVEEADEHIVNGDFVQKADTIENIIAERYYLDEVELESLREGAYEGIVEALGDIYSVYYTPEEAAELFQESEGIYYGIGAYVEMDTVSGYVKVTGLIEGTPAEEAGLQPGDIFYKADGEDLAGLDTTQVVHRIKGEEGTSVHLTMVRDNTEFEVDVVRRKIESPTVESEILEDGIGYIQLIEFDDVTVAQFEKALQEIKEADCKGMILDLRGNPGGNLGAVLDISDMLLEEGLILYTEDKQGNRQSYNSDASCEWDKPIVVLVDGNSASAAEVLSGALKDHGKATLVGTTTFGKGIVQSVITLKDGSAIKLTVSAYYTPSGTNIHGTGIEPDVTVEFDGEAYYGPEAFDNQLDKAKEVLKELIQ